MRNTTNAAPLRSQIQVQDPALFHFRPATYMPDEPKALPELISILRLGSMISGECSACHEVMLVKGSGTQTLGELSSMIKQAFLEHLQRKQSLESQHN